MDTLALWIQKFINRYRRSDAPLIIGYSGGPDSTALVHLLLAAGIKNFHLAHFDHGWREESALEAKLLEKKANQWKVPFSSERGEASTYQENEAREARFAFFERLYNKLGAASLILAHQKEDLAETVLKRVFEGAHLTSIHGMEPISEWRGMELWRPLLKTPKKELKRYLELEGEGWIEDPTNEDPRYLRGRMRGGLMADLSATFGKEINEPLTRLSERSLELEAYLERRAAFVQEVGGPFGTFWELPKERVEARYLLRQILKKRGLIWTHNELEKALSLINENAANRKLAHTFFVDRGLLFSIESSGADVEIEATLSKSPPPYHSDWRSAWQGRAWLGLKEKNYTLSSPEGASFSKWWGNHKVPVCVRSLFPIVCREGKESLEFLSGKNRGTGCTFPIYLQLKVNTRQPISCSAGMA